MRLHGVTLDVTRDRVPLPAADTLTGHGVHATYRRLRTAGVSPLTARQTIASIWFAARAATRHTERAR